MTNVPATQLCRYCNVEVPLDYDPETGFYARDYHWVCVWETEAEEAWLVVTWLKGEVRPQPRRYLSRLRAREEAQDLARHNNGWWAFEVVGPDGETTHMFDGQLEIK